jgi:hypothetical protein
MESALFWGLATFGACWLMHWCVWRIRVPKGYLIWLPAIFWLLPLAGTALFWVAGDNLPRTETAWFGWILAALLHLAVSSCYICGYAGITEYSPSAEVLLAVREHMPRGVPVNELCVRSFTEYCLTGQRIEDLRASRLVAVHDGRLRVTRRGGFALALSRVYRVLVGVEPTGRG